MKMQVVETPNADSVLAVSQEKIGGKMAIAAGLGAVVGGLGTYGVLNYVVPKLKEKRQSTETTDRTDDSVDKSQESA